MKKKKVILGLGIFLVLIVTMTLIWTNFSKKPVDNSKGSKKVTIEVTNSKGETVTYSIQTDADYLEQAMNEVKEEGLTFEGKDTTYGLTIISVNNEKADFNSNGAYWAFYVNDAYCNYGVSEQPVEDGDVFKIVYTKGM